MTEETKHNKIRYLPLLLSLLPIVLYDSLFRAFSNYYLITGIGITFLFIWYIIISRNEPALDIKKTFAPKTVGSVLLTSLGVNFISGLIILIILFILPDMMEEYAEHMDYGVDKITLFLYSVILGPIGEELCFRGVSMSYLLGIEKQKHLVQVSDNCWLRHSGRQRPPFLWGQSLLFAPPVPRQR